MDPRSKVDYAALYLEGDADKWYQTIQESQPLLTWETFTALDFPLGVRKILLAGSIS